MRGILQRPLSNLLLGPCTMLFKRVADSGLQRGGHRRWPQSFGTSIGAIKRAFPHHCILLRGDSGFNSRKIIKTCENQNICYVIGFSPNKKAQALVAKQGLVNARRKEKKRYTTKGTAFRTLGKLIGYKAASWEFHRRLIARKQHDPKTNQIDHRLIQTNIIKGAKFGDKGYCGQCSSFNPERLYEYLYCGRARDCEFQIGMFKTACFGARASSTRFLTNSYHDFGGILPFNSKNNNISAAQICHKCSYTAASGS